MAIFLRRTNEVSQMRFYRGFGLCQVPCVLEVGEAMDRPKLFNAGGARGVGRAAEVRTCQFCGRDTRARHGICAKCLGPSRERSDRDAICFTDAEADKVMEKEPEEREPTE